MFCVCVLYFVVVFVFVYINNLYKQIMFVCTQLVVFVSLSHHYIVSFLCFSSLYVYMCVWHFSISSIHTSVCSRQLIKYIFIFRESRREREREREREKQFCTPQGRLILISIRVVGLVG